MGQVCPLISWEPTKTGIYCKSKPENKIYTKREEAKTRREEKKMQENMKNISTIVEGKT